MVKEAKERGESIEALCYLVNDFLRVYNGSLPDYNSQCNISPPAGKKFLCDECGV